MKLLSLLFCLFYLLPVQAADIGIISSIRGSVEWRYQDQVLSLKRGDSFSSGAEVVTGPDARLLLKMNDNSLITLGGNTRLQFSDWRYRDGAQDNGSHLKLTEGVFRFVTGMITRQSVPDLTVETPSATIGIRGTDFWGGYLDADVLDVILLEGEHALEITNGQGTVLIGTPGQGISVKRGDAPSAPVTWTEEKLQRAVRSITF